VDRPSALDLAFLDLETSRAPLHVGWTLRFAGTAPDLAALRLHLADRLAAVPRFRRRLAGGGLDAPHWVDDPRFDLAHHVFAVTLRAPGGPAQLRETAGVLLSRPLLADRPLWRLYLVDGLQDGGFAIVGQAHHALIDGLAAIEVARLLFGPPAGEDPATAWTPAPAPPGATAALGTTAARLRSAGAAACRLGTAVARPGAAIALAEAANAVAALARPSATTALDRSATPERVVAYGSVPLDGVRAAGLAQGATVNDVLLAACALALRRTLRRRDETPARLRALVPVSVRGRDPSGAAALGNRISFLSVELPLDERDPERVLRAIRTRSTAAKTGGQAGALEALALAADALPGPGRRALVRAAARTVSFNLVISNVPGPPAPLELLGRPLLSLHPMVPLLHGHALSIGAVSYEGELALGLAADAAVVPDVARVAEDLEAAFEALRSVATARRRTATPWAARATARRQRAAKR